jgi:hypothetical protein
MFATPFDRDHNSKTQQDVVRDGNQLPDRHRPFKRFGKRCGAGAPDGTGQAADGNADE